MLHPDDPRNETALDRLIDPQPCTWTEDCDYWEATCGGAFTFNDGGPTDNGFKFCPYCGKPLVAVPCTEPADIEG
jgi:hypothetical protein